MACQEKMRENHSAGSAAGPSFNRDTSTPARPPPIRGEASALAEGTQRASGAHEARHALGVGPKRWGVPSGQQG